MKFKHLALILLFIPSLAVAQYTSRLGRFQVDEIKGCAPFTITITDTNLITVSQCDGDDPCDMTWDDGVVQQNTFTHTYTQPGTYTLSILYQSPLGSDDIEITVTPNTQPDFDIITCGNREVEVRVTDTDYDSYFINFNDGTEVQVPSGNLAFANHTYAAAGAQTVSVRGKNVNAADNCTPPLTKPVTVLDVLPAPFIDALTVTSTSQIDLSFTSSPNILYRLEIAVNTGSFQTVQTLYNVSTTSITNLTPDNNYYCFRLGAFDPCNNTIVYSNTICSANFDASPVSNAINLAWTTSTSGVANFTINRDGSTLGSTGGLSFSDNTVDCTITYSYQLITTYTNGSQSTSLAKSVTAFSNDVPTAVEDVTAVVGSGVELTWLQDPAFQTTQYRIYRKSGSGNLSLLNNAVITQFTDPAYSTNDEYCYRIDYVDDCGNSSLPGIEVCPIRLSGSVNSENEIRLDWSAYTGWQNGVDEYIVEKYDTEGVPLQVFNAGTNLFYEDATVDVTHQQYVYVVVANANDAGLGQAVSNEITITKNPNIFYPTAFTPDGMGDIRNEVFKVFGQFVETFEMNIFNRWGELLFTTTDINQGWDGNFRGKPQPEGTYAFSATLTDFEGRTFKRSGSFVLLRKK